MTGPLRVLTGRLAAVFIRYHSGASARQLLVLLSAVLGLVFFTCGAAWRVFACLGCCVETADGGCAVRYLYFIVIANGGLLREIECFRYEQGMPFLKCVYYLVNKGFVASSAGCWSQKRPGSWTRH